MVYLAVATMIPDDAGELPDVDAEMLTDALWATADPTDSVEHISVITHPGCVYLGLYLNVGSQEEAALRGGTIADRACRELPLLKHWRRQP